LTSTRIRPARLIGNAATLVSVCVALHAVSSRTYAADVLIAGESYAAPVLTSPSAWQFRVTPFAWAPSVNGDATVRGQQVDVDLSFWDLFDSGSSRLGLDSLAALMGYAEARKGAWALYGDAVWGRFDFSGSGATEKNPLRNVRATARADAGLDYETTMAEAGLAYQIAAFGSPGFQTAFDAIGGARYWNQELDVSLAVDAAVDVDKLGLQRQGSRAIARSGTLEWVDPFVGMRLRHQLAPGQELLFLGDVGGLGAGSDLTWQLFGAYSFDFSAWQKTLYGVVGYRALAVDYTGSGPRQNNLDLILHGPVLGLSFRW
jgi:hypothetical protein